MGDRRTDRAEERAESKDQALPEAVEKVTQDLGNTKELSRQFSSYRADKDGNQQLTKDELTDARRTAKDPEERAALDYAVKNFDKIANENTGTISWDDIARHARTVAESALLSLAKNPEDLTSASLYMLGTGLRRGKATEAFVEDLNKKLASSGIKDAKFRIEFDEELPSTGIGGGTDHVLYLEKDGKSIPVARGVGLRAKC